MNIQEDYVSFETAKLLKEKGFNGILPWVYIDTKKSDKKPILLDTLCNYNDGHIKDIISAPTLQMAMKWLRKVYMIDIVITPSMFRRKYNMCIYKDENLCCVDFDGTTLSPSYEYACEAAIKYCLENLI